MFTGSKTQYSTFLRGDDIIDVKDEDLETAIQKYADYKLRAFTKDMMQQHNLANSHAVDDVTRYANTGLINVNDGRRILIRVESDRMLIQIDTLTPRGEVDCGEYTVGQYGAETRMRNATEYEWIYGYDVGAPYECLARIFEAFLYARTLLANVYEKWTTKADDIVDDIPDDPSEVPCSVL